MILKDFSFDTVMLQNTTVNRKFRRANITAYRGESSASGTGMAVYGRGIYSSQRKSTARKYGTVRVVSYEELPYNPFRVKSEVSYELLSSVFRNYCLSKGVSLDDFYKHEGLVSYLKYKGYDGLTIGIAPDNIIVKWTDVR